MFNLLRVTLTAKTILVWTTFALSIFGSVAVQAQVTVDSINFPSEIRPSWLDTVDPANFAIAYYDYKTTPGFEGQFTSFSKGSNSLFDETQSGLANISSDFSWVEGTGWVASGSDVTFRWKNIRVPTNDKHFAQVITLGKDTDVTSVTITTDKVGDKIGDTVWHVFDEASDPKIDINKDGDFTDHVLIVSATIHPQPDDVFVNVVFAGTVIEQGWVLDQCSPVPEPSFLALCVASGLSGVRLLQKNRTRKKALLQTS